MCLPFCCGDDHGSPSESGTGMTTTHRLGHGDGHAESVNPPSTGNGKQSAPTPRTGNGASEDDKEQDFKDPPRTPPPHYSPPATPRMGNGPEDWAEQMANSSTPSGQAFGLKEKRQKTSSATPVGQGPKLIRVPNIVDPLEHGYHISRTSAPANQAPKQSERVADGPRRQEPVAVPQQPQGKATDTMRTPPSPQIARRGREDDYSPIASPTVPVPAANNGLGDQGHGEESAYGGKDGRRPPGKSGR